MPEVPVRTLSRRGFLRYVGAGTGLVLGAELGPLARWLEAAGAPHPGAWVLADGTPGWSPPPYPVPLPGDLGPVAGDAARLSRFTVVDDLVLPAGFRYDVVARWGDVFGPPGEPARQIRFGYNCDYTGLVPIAGAPDQFYLLVNHEYVSARPWLQTVREVLGEELADFQLIPDPDRRSRGRLVIDGWDAGGETIDLERDSVPAAVRSAIARVSELALSEQGVSVLRVRRTDGGRVEVVAGAPDHRRIAAASSQNVPPAPGGGPPFRFSGPAAALLTKPPRGTMCNCSGGTTPWGTFLTCEENFQDQCQEEVAPDGTLAPDRGQPFHGEGALDRGRLDASVPEPLILEGFGHGLGDPLDGRHYGWVTEIDPRTGELTKHTALGRFRHENVTLRAVAGRRLAAYMGDDRRGGHVWKFVSDEVVQDPADPANGRLLASGTLFVARFSGDFKGRWIPLVPETPLVVPEPEHGHSEHLLLPARPAGGFEPVGNPKKRRAKTPVRNWVATIEAFTGKDYRLCTLGDLVRPAVIPGDPAESRRRALGVLLLDAFAMANAVGGTPSARPEDLEVHPGDGSVYIAFTDSTGSAEGSPDRRVFPDSAGTNSRQYGAIYRLAEDGDDPAAQTFTWGKFVASGEVAEQGGGFANADNLAFDPAANLWMVTDISTTVQNSPTERSKGDGTHPGGSRFPGIFGNNALFMIPARGPAAGIPHCFATGPMECELTGPTFLPDGLGLILSVQHPGERHGRRPAHQPARRQWHVIHDRANHAFQQERFVPLGSNFPSRQPGAAPRPSVVCIRRS